MDITYNATPILSAFHNCGAFVRGVMGPVGSGKSTGMCFEIMKRAHEQRISCGNGIRKTRWAVVRNTYRELKDTTLKTWLDWFPEHTFGPFKSGDMEHHIKIGNIYLEVLFRALDRPEDVKKLMSLEITGAWINEAREVPKAVLDVLCDRVGRYPSARELGPSWCGVFMDTNPPDDDHWWYKLAETACPSNHRFFKQPGGLIEQGLDSAGQPIFVPNPAAENLINLPPNYYQERMHGKSLDHVRVYYCNQYGFTLDGRPIIPEYNDQLHCASEPLKPVKGVPIRIGLDFGLTPAAVFGQRFASGRWIWFHELTSDDMGIMKFSQVLIDEINQKFAGHVFEDSIWGDPAGEQRAQTDERTPFEILNANLERARMPMRAYPAPTNDFTVRRESIARPLTRLLDGKPGLLISPDMSLTRKGLKGGYCYKRLQVSGSERYQDKPDKNRYSHPVEAGGYMMLGGGEGYALVEADSDFSRREEEPETVSFAKPNYSPVTGY